MAVAKDSPVGGPEEPDDLIVLTREKIQATLDQAASLGSVTRAAANELMGELLRLGRQQTDALFSELVDRTGLRSQSSFPIDDYESLIVAQVLPRLEGLNGMQLHQVREFERKHANRKSVLDALEKALA
jgi:hypothetical protein